MQLFSQLKDSTMNTINTIFMMLNIHLLIWMGGKLTPSWKDLCCYNHLKRTGIQPLFIYLNCLNFKTQAQSGMHPLTDLTFNNKPEYNWHAATVSRLNHVTDQDQSGIHPLTGLSAAQVEPTKEKCFPWSIPWPAIWTEEDFEQLWYSSEYCCSDLRTGTWNSC